MLEAVSAKTRVAPDDIRRKVVLALAGGLMTIAGLGFAVGALWILAAPVWGAAAAFGIFAAAFLAASATTWLIYLVASRRAAREAELARIHHPARVDTALTAFRVGADTGSRLRRIQGAESAPLRWFLSNKRRSSCRTIRTIRSSSAALSHPEIVAGRFRVSTGFAGMRNQNRWPMISIAVATSAPAIPQSQAPTATARNTAREPT